MPDVMSSGQHLHWFYLLSTLLVAQPYNPIMPAYCTVKHSNLSIMAILYLIIWQINIDFTALDPLSELAPTNAAI